MIAEGCAASQGQMFMNDDQKQAVAAGPDPKDPEDQPWGNSPRSRPAPSAQLPLFQIVLAASSLAAAPGRQMRYTLDKQTVMKSIH